MEREIDVADRRCSRHPLASGPNPSQSRRAQRSLIKRAPVSVIGQKSGLSSPSPLLVRCLLPFNGCLGWTVFTRIVRRFYLTLPSLEECFPRLFVVFVVCKWKKKLESGDWDSTVVVREETRERIWKNCLKIFVHTLVPIYILFNIEFIE